MILSCFSFPSSPAALCTALHRAGGGGGGHDACMERCLQLAWPLATYPCPFPFPPPVAVPIGLSPPCTPSSPCLCDPHRPTHPSFPSVRCAHGAPGLSLFHCSVSGPHGGGQRPSPLAGCAQAARPGGGGNPLQQRLLGPGMSIAGSLPRPGGEGWHKAPAQDRRGGGVIPVPAHQAPGAF